MEETRAENLLFRLLTCLLLFLNGRRVIFLLLGEGVLGFYIFMRFFLEGEGFGKGRMNLGGGLEVCEVTSFSLVWAAFEGGPDNGGAAFLRPSPIPEGFYSLGCYAQSQKDAVSGWVLAGRDVGHGGAAALAPPVDFTLIWTSKGSKLKRSGDGFFWLPVAPQGYSAVGLLVTTTEEKPSVQEIRCVRSDLTEPSEPEQEIWSQGKTLKISAQRPATRGSKASGVALGTFSTSTPPLSCLKNTSSLTSLMPNKTQIETLAKTYSPFFYFHPKEPYLPSSVSWYFANGAFLKKKDDPSETLITANGSNLPQGGDEDGEFWIDVPSEGPQRERALKGDVASAEVYLHVKPILGGSHTDLAYWLFFPFNGPARAKVGPATIDIKPFGQHVADWEHVTVRVSNLTGDLKRVYFSQHSRGQWVEKSKLEYRQGNKPAVFVSLRGHAVYPKEGLVMQGTNAGGLRNDAAAGGPELDGGSRWVLIAADHLGDVVVPPWLEYRRPWGPKVRYWTDGSLKKVIGFLPNEVFGEDSPTGPRGRGSWEGDERS